MECYSCKSLSGENRISPGPLIFEGKYWVIEHAYPIGIVGWLVIVLKRHAEALHELTPEEFNELALLMNKTCKLLHDNLGSYKEYAACFAEAEHFNHIHFHIIPTDAEFPKDLKGSSSFKLLSVTKEESVSKEAVIKYCENLRKLF
jgi:diadenosine tetraphosphate (Ap4A) HIT family hydrolase